MPLGLLIAGLLVMVLADFCFSQESGKTTSERSLLVRRYEFPISPGPAWDQLRKPLRDLRIEEPTSFAVRICSEERLLTSLPSAVSDVFRISRDIRSRYPDNGASPEIYFLSSGECKNGGVRDMFATEVWAIPRSAKPPKHNEIYNSDQIHMEVLGFDTSNCSTRTKDYLKAFQKVIDKMRTNPQLHLVVSGYRYPLDKELDPALDSRLRKIHRLLGKTDIQPSRYRISREIWRADDSVCTGEPILQPTFHLLSVGE